MKVGVIGGGTVGRATARVWLEHADVRVWDKVKARCTYMLEYALDSDIVFICLPEASVDEFFSTPTSAAGFKSVNFVLKSTVPIGTTRQLAEQHGLTNLVHNPEFLTARCAVADALNPAVQIIGSPFRTTMTEAGHLLQAAYVNRFPGVPLYFMQSDESEAVKLFLNAAFAVKVSLFNELRTLADKLRLDWDRIREGMLADGRICPSHTQVPGRDGYGFAGNCLPKDLDMLIGLIEKHVSPGQATICRAAKLRNDLVDRRKQ